MKNTGDITPPHDQPGYWQFYANSDDEAACEQRRIAAGNQLIALGLGGVAMISALMLALSTLR